MTNDDYELLPHEEINRLKREIEKLKKSSGSNPKVLVDSMDSLSSSINSLLGIFKEAAEEMKLDEHDSVMLSDKITPLLIKVDKVLEQNEKIAKGIVAIADMVETIQAKIGYQSPRKPQSNQPSKNVYPNIPGTGSSFSQQTNLPSGPRFPSKETQPKPLPGVPSSQKEKKKKPFFKLKF
jgi:hypothetical protein